MKANLLHTEIMQELHYYIMASAHTHLADCLELVPEANLIALYNMICQLQSQKAYKKVIAMQVAEDISKIVEGKPELAEFSIPFLNVEA